MNVIEKSPKNGLQARHLPQANKFTLTGCDHFALPARDPEASGKYFEQVLGGVEFFRAGYGEDDRAKNKARHIFYHVGSTLVELVEQRTERGYPDYTNPDGENGNPHWAFGTTLNGLAAFAEHLKREGIPFAGPRRHGKDISAVSVYFLDLDGNILEVTTWEEHAPDSFINPPAPGERFIEATRLKHNWKPHN